MASHHPYRRTREVERKFVRQELVEGWLCVLARAVLVVVSTVLGVTAIAHAPETSQWHVTIASGGGSVLLAGLAANVRRKPPEG